MGYRASHFVQRDGLIYLKGYYRHNAKDARVALERLVLPDSLRTWVVSQLHDSPTACHLGRNRVVASLKRRFYFPNIDQVVQRYIRTCARCQKSKAQTDKRAGLLKSKEFFTPGMLGVDLQGPFPRSGGRYDTILTLKDCFLGVVVLVPLDAAGGKTSAKYVADAIMDRWIPFFGIPRVCLSDRGPQFVSALFERLCERLGIDHRLTAAYSPSTNSETERQNGFQIALLRAICEMSPRKWHQVLPYLQFAVNSSPVEGHGYSPLEALTGFLPNLPVDLYTLPKNDYSFAQDKHMYKLEHAKHMRQVHGLMKRVKKEQAQKNKVRVDKDKREVSYNVGDLVLAYAPPRMPGSQKLVVKFRGPFVVEKVLGATTLSLKWKDGESPKRFTANVRNVVRFHVRKPEATTTWVDVDTALPRPRPPPRARAEPERARPAVEREGGEAVTEKEEDLVELRNMTNKKVFFYKTAEKGLGVYARVPLTKGMILTEYTGERLSKKEHKRRYREMRPHYSVSTENGVIDASDWKKSGWARYVNAAGPSETPNVKLVEGDHGRVFIRVIRSIGTGTELMLNYGANFDWAKESDRRDGPRARPKAPLLQKFETGEALRAILEEDSDKLPEFESSDDEDSPPPPPPEDEDEEEAVEGGEGPAGKERAHTTEANASSVEPLSEDIKVGDFVLCRLDMPPCSLRACEVLHLDVMGEHAQVHVYGNYAENRSDEQKQKVAPSYVDPKDNKNVFTWKPKARYLADTAQIWAEHVYSEPFALEKGKPKGRVPESIRDVPWWLD